MWGRLKTLSFFPAVELFLQKTHLSSHDKSVAPQTEIDFRHDFLTLF